MRKNKNEKPHIANDWNPVKAIVDGVIALKNGVFVTVLEVTPINFKLRSKLEKKSIILNYREFLKACPFEMQISIQCKKASIEPHISRIESFYINEANPNAKSMTKGYMQLIKSLGAKGAVTRRFFLVIPYKPIAGSKHPAFADIKKQLFEKSINVQEYLKICGNIVSSIEEIQKEGFLENILYSAINKDFQSKNWTNHINFDKKDLGYGDFLSPKSIDTRDPGCIKINDKFISTVLVVTYPYERSASWLSDIINLGEGIETNIYYEPQDKLKTIKNITYMIGESGAKRKAMGDNQNDVDIVDTSIGHARYMRQQININNEDPYNMYILVSVYADNKEELEDKLRSVESVLGAKDITSKRADFRHENGFKACLPLHGITPDLKKSTMRNALSMGVASTYPFCTFEFCDENGILVGKNEHNNSLVIVDIFNTALYKNANSVILGTSGAGKTFLIQLLALRLRLQNIPAMIIAPLKGHEFKKSCLAIGGEYIKISPSSNHCINIMEIRKSTLELEFEEGDFENVKDTGNESLLLAKIQKLHIFFSLVFTDMTAEEKEYLDEKLIEVYSEKGITFDNESLYLYPDREFRSEDEINIFKEMPVLGDLYNFLEKEQKTQRLALFLKRLVTGSLKAFNQQTNVDLNNKYIVADISELKGDLLPIGMFIAVDLFWDKIKEDRTQKKVIFLDELWKLIGTSGNKLTAEFVLEIFKIIRGYGGAAVGGTQDINDFFALEGGKYGKGIINNSKLKFVLQLEEDEAEALKKVLKLSDDEMAKVTSFARGHGLFYAGPNHVAIEFKASDEEKALITTDRAELEEIKKINQSKQNLQID